MKRKKPSTEDYIRGMIAGQMKLLGLKDEDVYKECGLGKSAYMTKKHSPMQFRTGELYRVMDYLDVDIKFVPRY